MMKRKKVDVENIDNKPPIEGVKDWAFDRFAAAAIWNRRLLIVLSISLFGNIVLALSIFGLLPLKEQIPIFVRVNDTTGVIDVLTSLDETVLTKDQALDEAFVIRYVRERETYLYAIFEKNYEQVMAMSSVAVGDVYNKIVIDNKNPKNPFVKYSDKYEVSVHINNVTNIEARTSGNPGTTVVRYTLKITEVGSGQTKEHKKIATITYEYTPASLERQRRWLNPLGFVVTSYLNEDEY